MDTTLDNLYFCSQCNLGKGECRLSQAACRERIGEQGGHECPLCKHDVGYHWGGAVAATNKILETVTGAPVLPVPLPPGPVDDPVDGTGAHRQVGGRRRHRIKYFSSGPAHHRRLDKTKTHTIGRLGTRQYCVICSRSDSEKKRMKGSQVTSCCTTCEDIPLCVKVKRRGEVSCFDQFHSTENLSDLASKQ